MRTIESATSTRPITEPVAPQRPSKTTHHGRCIDDPWAWLRDPGYPEVNDKDVLAYLEEENRWFDAAMAPQAGLIDDLHLALRPLLLGRGEALFAGLDLDALGYECTGMQPGERAVHMFLRKRAG